MIIIKISSGLGNQLFQYALYLNFIKNNIECPTNYLEPLILYSCLIHTDNISHNNLQIERKIKTNDNKKLELKRSKSLSTYNNKKIIFSSSAVKPIKM